MQSRISAGPEKSPSVPDPEAPMSTPSLCWYMLFQIVLVLLNPLFRKPQILSVQNDRAAQYGYRTTSDHVHTRRVKRLLPLYTAFGDFIDEANTLQHICDVIESSFLFKSHGLHSLQQEFKYYPLKSKRSSFHK